jgi:hypothetical protein
VCPRAFPRRRDAPLDRVPLVPRARVCAEVVMGRALALVLGTAFLLTACGQKPGAAGDGSMGDGFLTCETDTRAVPYHPGMEVESSAQPPVFRLKLLESVPGPPVKGRNTWTVEVDELATGAALDDLELTVTPYMPDHMHGTIPVVVTPAGAGTYTLAPVYLYMSGVWQVRFTIVGRDVAGGTTDTAMIPVCIP